MPRSDQTSLSCLGDSLKYSPSTHQSTLTKSRRLCFLGLSVVVTGKGGTGKTAIAALIVRALMEKTDKAILAIDADPNSNLNQVLGVPLRKTVGDIREQLLDEKEKFPPEMSKESYLEFMVQSSMTEGSRFDLLAMGRPEGPGCYCYVNTLLRRIVDTISGNYAFVVMDAEAGLEHLSRRTTKDVDIMLVATDPTMRSMETARRILELSKELKTNVRHVYVVANRVPNSLRDTVRRSVESLGLDCIAVVPEDPAIQEYDMAGKPLMALPDTSPSYRAINEMMRKMPLKTN